MKLTQLLVISALCGLVIVGNGCSAVRGGLSTGRTVVNKAFDFADKAVDTVETISKNAVEGAVDTAAPVISSQPTPTTQ